MRMASLQFKKANVFDSKSRYGVRCLKGIPVPPQGAIKPISQRSLTVGNSINIYKPNHLAFQYDCKSICFANFPLTLVICEPLFDRLPVRWI